MELVDFDTSLNSIEIPAFFEPPTGVYDLTITEARWLDSDDSLLRIEYCIDGVIEGDATEDAIGKTFSEMYSRARDRVGYLVKVARPVIEANNLKTLEELVNALQGLQITAAVTTKPNKRDKSRMITNTSNWVLR